MNKIKVGDRVKSGTSISGEVIRIERHRSIDFAVIFTGERYTRRIPVSDVQKVEQE